MEEENDPPNFWLVMFFLFLVALLVVFVTVGAASEWGWVIINAG